MKREKIKTLKSLKNKLKKILPGKILEVMQSYSDFSEQGIPVDAKGFSAHHSACKSAVNHAETLLKLAKWTEDEIPDKELSDNDYGNISRLLQEAKSAYEEDNSGEEGDEGKGQG